MLGKIKSYENDDAKFSSYEVLGKKLVIQLEDLRSQFSKIEYSSTGAVRSSRQLRLDPRFALRASSHGFKSSSRMPPETSSPLTKTALVHSGLSSSKTGSLVFQGMAPHLLCVRDRRRLIEPDLSRCELYHGSSIPPRSPVGEAVRGRSGGYLAIHDWFDESKAHRRLSSSRTSSSQRRRFSSASPFLARPLRTAMGSAFHPHDWRTACDGRSGFDSIRQGLAAVYSAPALDRDERLFARKPTRGLEPRMPGLAI